MPNNDSHPATQHLLSCSSFGIKVAPHNSSTALIKDIKIMVVESTRIVLLVGPHNCKCSL